MCGTDGGGLYSPLGQSGNREEKNHFTLFNSNVSPVVVFQTIAVMTFSLPLPSSTFMPEVSLYQLEPPVREAVYRAAVFV